MNQDENHPVVVLVVPYRDTPDGARAEHLRTLLEWHHGQTHHLKLIVVEQSTDHKFNRGLLLNIGRTRATELYPEAAAIIYHDVDLIPSHALTALYTTQLPTVDTCVHFGSAWGFYGQRGYVGGVLSVHPHSPPFPTQIYGWGKEDDLWLYFWKNAPHASNIVRVQKSSTVFYTNLETHATVQDKQQFLRTNRLKCDAAWEWVEHYKRMGPPAPDDATPHEVLREESPNHHLVVRLPGPVEPPLRSIIAVAYDTIAASQRRRNNRSLSPIDAARARHNYIKMCLLYEMREHSRVSGGGPSSRALDLASGKGGDLRKWQSVCDELVGIDISGKCVEEAKRRAHKSRFDATYQVASMVDPDLDLGLGRFDYAACMFAAHYACETDETLAYFFENVSAHLKPGGACVCVYPDYYTIEQILRTGIPLPGVTIEGWTSGARGTGHKYMFRMEGCVACPEFQVDPDTWTQAAIAQGLEIVQQRNLCDALHDCLKRDRALAQRMGVRPEHLTGDLRLTQMYCCCVLRKVPTHKRTRRE